MPTVSQAVDIIEKVTDLDGGTVSAIARKLLDNDLLPRSYGTRIERITPNQFAMLLFASYGSDTVRQAPEVAIRYSSLKRNHGTWYYPQKIAPISGRAIFDRRVAEAALTASGEISQLLTAYVMHLTKEENSIENHHANSYITMCLSHDEVIFTDVMVYESEKTREKERVLYDITYNNGDTMLNKKKKPVRMVRIPYLALLDVAKMWLELNPELLNMSPVERACHIVHPAPMKIERKKRTASVPTS